MSHLITNQFNPEWADQTVEPGGHGAAVGGCDDTRLVNKLNRKIRFDWIHAPKQPVFEKHLEPGQHIKVKPREDVKHGSLRFQDLCKKMGLKPSTFK